MRFLFDQNLSPRLKAMLGDIFPDSVHVRDVGLEAADDVEVWTYARSRNLVIVSKDYDFRQLSFAYGFPPKVVWIRLGNCSTSEVASLLRDWHDELTEFCNDESGAFLALS